MNLCSLMRSWPRCSPARKRIRDVRRWRAGWGNRQTPAQIPLELVEWELGPGETSVLALARERAPCTVILDDAAARACAKAFGVPLLGTLGVVLRAKKRGIISSAAEVLRTIRAAGFRLDDRVLQVALGRIGETW